MTTVPPSPAGPNRCRSNRGAIELLDEVTDVVEFYLGLRAVHAAITCRRCNGSAAPPAPLTAAHHEQMTSQLNLYLSAVIDIEATIDWPPDELFDPRRRTKVEELVATSGLGPLNAIDEVVAAIAKTKACSGPELLADAWYDRSPGLLVPARRCTCGDHHPIDHLQPSAT